MGLKPRQVNKYKWEWNGESIIFARDLDLFGFLSCVWLRAILGAIVYFLMINFFGWFGLVVCFNVNSAEEGENRRENEGSAGTGAQRQQGFSIFSLCFSSTVK